MRVAISFVLFLLACRAQEARGQTVALEKYRGKAQQLSRVRIAAASVVPKKWDKEENWRRIEDAVREAAGHHGAQVVVLPEGVLEGYVINEVNRESDPEKKADLVKRFVALAEPISGPFVLKACALAKELRIYLVLGFLERLEAVSGPVLYNSVVLTDPTGDIIGRYAKTHFAQGYSVNPSCYQPGSDYPVIETPFGKVGILICYDRQLPEPARVLAVKGAQMLLLPSYGSYTEDDGWNTVLLRTRAYENRMPLVFSHPQQSLLISERGEIKAKGAAGDTTVFEVDTSPKRYKGRFRNRRPSTYGPLVETSAGLRESE